MKVAVAYVKYAVIIAAYVAYVFFVVRLSRTLEPHLSDVERFTVLGLSIVGAAYPISKANEYISSKMFR